MFVISRSLIVQEKMNRIANGQSAYAESKDVIRLLEKELERRQIPFVSEKTDIGCWFTPNNDS